MALHGRFYLNKADFCTRDFGGVGRFPAFSGMDAFRNQPGCTYLKNDGAIPAGRYWIVDRPVGGYRTRFRAGLASIFGSNIRKQWFALYRDDGVVDDWTFINGVRRGNFRLHPMGPNQESKGCVTMLRETDFLMLRNMLLRTPTVMIPNTDLAAYGTLEVIGNEDYCPAL